jgi:threonine dehydrogenase-like Zn-dependent dehydrogenase
MGSPASESTMNALRFHGQNDLRYEKIPVPQVKAGQVKVKPAWVGICGTGMHSIAKAEAARLTLIYTFTNIWVCT